MQAAEGSRRNRAGGGGGEGAGAEVAGEAPLSVCLSACLTHGSPRDVKDFRILTHGAAPSVHLGARKRQLGACLNGFMPFFSNTRLFTQKAVPFKPCFSSLIRNATATPHLPGPRSTGACSVLMPSVALARGSPGSVGCRSKSFPRGGTNRCDECSKQSGKNGVTFSGKKNFCPFSSQQTVPNGEVKWKARSRTS